MIVLQDVGFYGADMLDMYAGCKACRRCAESLNHDLKHIGKIGKSVRRPRSFRAETGCIQWSRGTT